MTLFKKQWLAMVAGVGLYAQIPDFTPPTPLFRAAMKNDTAEALRLLAAGANPNEGRIAAGFSPTFFAVVNRNLQMLRAFADKGADVRLADATGSTLLMWAAASETGEAELVEELLKRGVDVNAVNKMGETAMTWALRRGDTPIVAALIRAGAAPQDKVQQAVEKSLALLQKSSAQFTRVSGCTSCHNQSLPQMVAGAARRRGFSVNEDISKNQLAAVVALFTPVKGNVEKASESIPDVPITVSYALLGMHAEGYAPDELTSALARSIALGQAADGSFRPMPARPPMESSDVTATALSLRALQLYGEAPEEAVARASQWLRSVTPKTTEESAMKLLGLAWAKADSAVLKAAAYALLGTQRQDGGWGQLHTLETDAYATGQALVALYESGQVPTSDAAYRRGTGYLLRTQLSDGSWLVRTRSFPLQPYKESGFPHGKDQWISAAGTSWAAMALSFTVPPSKPMESGVE